MNPVIEEYVDLDNILMDSEVVKLIPEEICLSNCIIAFKREESIICVAAGISIDSNTVSEIKSYNTIT